MIPIFTNNLKQTVKFYICQMYRIFRHFFDVLRAFLIETE